MLNAGHIVQRQTGLTLDSTTRTYEINQSEYNFQTTVTVSITAPSSLSAGVLRLEAYDPATDAWIVAPQEIALTASGGGTPGVVSGNTASATATVGGVVANSTGITAITNTATVTLTTQALGRRVRLHTAATSGSATLDYAATGFRNFEV